LSLGEVRRSRHALGNQFLSAGALPTPKGRTPSPEKIQQQRVEGKESGYGFKSFRYHDGKMAHIDLCHDFGSERTPSPS
jgi:hypothetical protein